MSKFSPNFRRSECRDCGKWVDNCDFPECQSPEFQARYALTRQWKLKVAADPLVRIQRCTDPHMWYAGLVGREVPIVRVDEDGLWAREPAGYINIIHFEAVEP